MRKTIKEFKSEQVIIHIKSNDKKWKTLCGEDHITYDQTGKYRSINFRRAHRNELPTCEECLNVHMQSNNN